jgi:hypothetical protein
MAQSFAFSNDQDRRGDLEVCRATLGGTGDDQRSPTRAKRARRRLTRRIVVVIVMGRDIMGESASVKERLPPIYKSAKRPEFSGDPLAFCTNGWYNGL